MKLISGSSNKSFTTSLAKHLQIDQIEVELTRFPNGEKRVWIKEAPKNIKSQNIVLVQSLTEPVDEHMMETLLLIDALERLGAKHVNVVIPWFGYSLQDKVFREGEPIAAKVVANLLSHSYVKRAFLLDLHNTSTTGFFAIPTHHLSALDTFVEYAVKKWSHAFEKNNIVAASPDFGGLKRARVFANQLASTTQKETIQLVNIDKHRDLKTGEVTAVQVQGGDVAGKIVLIMDDVIVSGGTVLEAAKLLKEEGAAEVHFFATHGLLIGEAKTTLNNSAIDSIIVTNSVEHASLPDRFEVLDIAPVFAQELQDWV